MVWPISLRPASLTSSLRVSGYAGPTCLSSGRALSAPPVWRLPGKGRPILAGRRPQQAVPVCHRDAADDRADDAAVALVGAAEEHILEVRRAVKLFVRRAIDGAVRMAGKAADRRGREHVGLDHPAAEVG